MRRSFAALVLLSGIAIGIAVHADAPPDQYAIFQAQSPTIKNTHAKLEWERFLSDAQAHL